MTWQSPKQTACCDRQNVLAHDQAGRVERVRDQALYAQRRKVSFVAKIRSGLSQLRDRCGSAGGLSVEPLNDRAVN